MLANTWLVTGAQGFLGANATLYLQDKVQTVGQVRKASAARVARTITDNLETAANTTNFITTNQPEVVLHIAALSSHQECEQDPEFAFKVNADATKKIAQACEAAGSQLIYISTDSVFSGTRGNYSELDNTEPFSSYGESKLQGEIYASQETNPLIIRTNFFGWSPNGTRSILEFFVNNLGAKNQIEGFTNMVTTSLYVTHALDYIWQLNQGNHRGVFHVTSRDALTKYEFGAQVAAEFGLDRQFITPTEQPLKRDISLNTSKLALTLNTAVRSQLEGIHQSHVDNADTGSGRSVRETLQQ